MFKRLIIVGSNFADLYAILEQNMGEIFPTTSRTTSHSFINTLKYDIADAIISDGFGHWHLWEEFVDYTAKKKILLSTYEWNLFASFFKKWAHVYLISLPEKGGPFSKALYLSFPHCYEGHYLQIMEYRST